MTAQGSILVTGGAGFLGSHLCRALLNDPRYEAMTVVVLDDLSGGFAANLPNHPRLRFVHGSITNQDTLDQIFASDRVEFVFHLAAYAAEGLSHFIRKFNYTNNLIGSALLINAAIRHEVRHFVFTSSIAVYGAAQTPMRESMQPLPEDPYGIAKYAVELDLHAARRQFGLNYTIFRPHNVYGEFQNIGDRYRNVVGIFMNCLLQNQPLPIFGDGLQQRAFSYVGDLMPAITAAPFVPEAAGQVFNIGAALPVTVLDLAHAVCREFQTPANLRFLPPRNEVRAAWADHESCNLVFGPAPETPLAVGLALMAAWVRQHGARSTPPFSQIEITTGLPESWITPP
jgi:UDP-glucose 4-epimerase